MSRTYRYKRPFDLAVLIAAHLSLLPLWVFLWTLIPLLVWLGDRGPVFYHQQRVGKDGQVISILKFRTMVPDAASRGPSWTVDGDRRVTRLGRLLRRTALDELPTLLAIWKGDMSLVGPRALELKEQKMLETRIPGFQQRLAARPGLTGLAQVYDPDDDAATKLKYDLEYIQRMGLWLDVKLLFLSVRNTLLARWDKRSGKGGQSDQGSPSPDAEVTPRGLSSTSSDKANSR